VLRRNWIVIVSACSFAFACLSAPPLGADLVAYWDFDGNVLDQSGNGNDGELFDAVYVDSVPAVIGSGQSLNFEFDTDHVYIEADDSLDSQTFTISMFVYDRGQVGALERLTSREADAFETAINVHPPFDGTGEYAYYSLDVGGWQWGEEVAALEEWQHVAYVANLEDETISIYVDGELSWVSIDPWYTLPTGFMHIGNRWNDVEGFDGMIDDVALWDEVLSDEDILAIAQGGVAKYLNGDEDPLVVLETLTDPQERLNYVHNTLNTWMGDANLDGLFDTSDLVAALSTGEYEDAINVNSTWAEGDWNGDKDFNSSDLVTALSDGGYEAGPRGEVAAAVPEPISALLFALGWLCLAKRRAETGYVCRVR
jgi:hypothetical protein